MQEWLKREMGKKTWVFCLIVFVGGVFLTACAMKQAGQKQEKAQVPSTVNEDAEKQSADIDDLEETDTEEADELDISDLEGLDEDLKGI